VQPLLVTSLDKVADQGYSHKEKRQILLVLTSPGRTAKWINVFVWVQTCCGLWSNGNQDFFILPFWTLMSHARFKLSLLVSLLYDGTRTRDRRAAVGVESLEDVFVICALISCGPQKSDPKVSDRSFEVSSYNTDARANFGRTRVSSQRQLPTDHDYAVSTREYQLDQSSPLPATAAADFVLVREKTTSAP
jgi:hypothetical protein